MKELYGSDKSIHETVLNLISKEKPGKVLDAASGKGAMSLALSKLGFKVTAVDIYADFKLHNIYPNIKFIKSDLNKDFPFKKRSFDYVVSLETIEHLENPHHFIRECARVLRNNGKLYLTTPNICNIYSRILFLCKSHFLGFDPNIKCHITPIPLWNLKEILKNNNFQIEHITYNRMCYPTIKFDLKQKKISIMLGRANILKNILFGECVCISAKKKK
ncbi:MAG: class I SAM-dependent methyltransferase [Promethearchaeota archaeon]